MEMPDSLPARFEAVEPVAETPFERSLRAHDTVLQRDVLLKLPARSAYEGWSAPVRDRLLREARAMAKIRHPAIAPIHSVEDSAEGPVLVLDPPDGELLVERLLRGPLEVAETIQLGIQIGEALAHVHFQGIVHRAVGPSTIRLLANGRAQLGSFTFAKEFGQRGQVSSLMHGERADSPIARYLPDYSAPEQLAGQAADPRADLFALGCTLFRCLAGIEAFAEGREHEPMPDLARLRKGVGRPLAEVIRKCALHGKTARYATAQEVVDALKALAAADAPGTGRAARWPMWVGLAAFALGAGLYVLRPTDIDADLAGFDVARDSNYERRYEDTYAPTYAKVHGLFVGIGQAYAKTPLAALKTPVAEIEAVSQRLAHNDPQWAAEGAVTRLADGQATKRAIVEQMRRIEREAGEEDAVIFYFAGHALRSDLQFGLACADVTSNDLELDNAYLGRDRLLTFAARCRAKHVLVVLDCCHAGALFDLGVPPGDVAPAPHVDEPLAEATRGAGRPPGAAQAAAGNWHQKYFSREFLCSASSNEQAKDGIDKSPFCRALLDGLSAPAVPGQEFAIARFLANDIGKGMQAGSGERFVPLQVPEIRQISSRKGSFVFRLAPGAK